MVVAVVTTTRVATRTVTMKAVVSRAETFAIKTTRSVVITDPTMTAIVAVTNRDATTTTSTVTTTISTSLHEVLFSTRSQEGWAEELKERSRMLW